MSWWLQPLPLSPAAAQSLGAGLDSALAAERLKQVGANRFREHAERPLWLQYLARFRNPLVLILLAASAVSAFSGELTNFLIISSIVLLSVTLDFVQEYRANAAAERLRLSVSLRARVLRDGQACDVPVSTLVPGDVVLLHAGDLVPADGRLLQARDFYVNQALLTGEPYPVEKHPGELPASASDLQDAVNAAFMGTSVISGSAQMLVVMTGASTAIGQIADSVSRSAAPTSFELGSRRFGMLIMRLTILMVMFVLLTNAVFGKPWLESFLFAVALAVGLTPELLPMVVSVTLARGALRMAQRQMIVKRPSAIQELGSMDVLCTDKTGTLTEARIHLERHVDVAGRDSAQVLQLAWLNSHFESGLKNPLDQAILEHHELSAEGWHKLDEVPFDFERRCVSVLLEQRGDGAAAASAAAASATTATTATRQLIVKGAPEDILRLCTRYAGGDGGGDQPIDDATRERIRARYQALEAEGFRVLGVAWRTVPPGHDHAMLDDERELTLAGFAGFLDPPKLSAAPALAALQQLGVAIKIVTGDSALVTRHVCRQLQIPVLGLLTGQEIAALDDLALQARVEATNLFCRVNPAQKERVILALKARGHVVGYLGDGINDAPSLHSADVGLSVDSAVDVAKAAADIILLQPDLDVLREGVMEGRRTFGNIMKYIMMGTSSNFGNMFSMAGAALFLPFLPMLPTQILLNNILYDLSEIPIPLDEVDAEELRQPRVLDMHFIRNFMLVVGPVSSLFDFLTFYLMLKVLHAGEALFQTGWFVESLCSQVLVIFVIRTRGNPLRSRAHPLLSLTSLTIVALALLLPYTRLGADFGFVPPPAAFYPLLGGMLLSYLLVVEGIKRWFYRRMGSTTPITSSQN